MKGKWKGRAGRASKLFCSSPLPTTDAIVAIKQTGTLSLAETEATSCVQVGQEVRDLVKQRVRPPWPEDELMP